MNGVGVNGPNLSPPAPRRFPIKGDWDFDRAGSTGNSQASNLWPVTLHRCGRDDNLTAIIRLPLLLTLLRLAPVSPLLKQVMPLGHRLVDSLGYLFPGLVLAKKLFAHEKHSYTEAIPGDILVVPVTGADLLAILNGIAAQGHSGTVPVAVKPLVVRKPLLDHLDNF